MAGKLVKKIIEGGVEVVKDSAKQLGQTVSPEALLDQALGEKQASQKNQSEITKYLQTLGPDLSPEELAKQREQKARQDEREHEEIKKRLYEAYPLHLKPKRPEKELSPYEKAQKDEEEKKKARAVEAQKQSNQMVVPTGKQARGMLGARRKVNKGFEGLKKDTKTG